MIFYKLYGVECSIFIVKKCLAISEKLRGKIDDVEFNIFD